MSPSSFAKSLLIVSFFAAQPVAAEVVEGQMIGNWKVTCENGPCRAFLTLQRDGTDVVTWQLLGDRASGAMSMLLTVPSGTALPPGVQVSASETSTFQIPFQVCDASGCIAATVVAQDMAAAIGAVEVAKVSYVRYGQSVPLRFDVPVAGFGEAFDKLLH